VAREAVKERERAPDLYQLPKARQQLLDSYSAPVTRVLDSSTSILSSISSKASALPIIGSYIPSYQ